MGGLKHKVLIKCNCGQTVSAGSVFCPYCKSEVQKQNDKIIKQEDNKYQKSVRGKRKKK